MDYCSLKKVKVILNKASTLSHLYPAGHYTHSTLIIIIHTIIKKSNNSFKTYQNEIT
jgi:hypothetical protein